jgi:hypothetical protein
VLGSCSSFLQMLRGKSEHPLAYARSRAAGNTRRRSTIWCSVEMRTETPRFEKMLAPNRVSFYGNIEGETAKFWFGCKVVPVILNITRSAARPPHLLV